MFIPNEDLTKLRLLKNSSIGENVWTPLKGTDQLRFNKSTQSFEANE